MKRIIFLTQFYSQVSTLNPSLIMSSNKSSLFCAPIQSHPVQSQRAHVFPPPVFPFSFLQRRAVYIRGLQRASGPALQWPLEVQPRCDSLYTDPDRWSHTTALVLNRDDPIPFSPSDTEGFSYDDSCKNTYCILGSIGEISDTGIRTLVLKLPLTAAASATNLILPYGYYTEICAPVAYLPCSPPLCRSLWWLCAEIHPKPAGAGTGLTQFPPSCFGRVPPRLIPAPTFCIAVTLIR